jgi:hypothetical protein
MSGILVSRAPIGVADQLSGDETSESASLGLLKRRGNLAWRGPGCAAVGGANLTGKTFELEFRVICETLFTVSFNDLFDPL